jgi:NADH dehydrogenase FAD-containing subunit
MAHPNADVTIVHGGRLPVSDAFPDSFREKALHALHDYGVKVILNEKVNLDSIGEKGQIRLSSGKTLPADLVVCLENFHCC